MRRRIKEIADRVFNYNKNMYLVNKIDPEYAKSRHFLIVRITGLVRGLR